MYSNKRIVTTRFELKASLNHPYVMCLFSVLQQKFLSECYNFSHNGETLQSKSA